MTIAEIENEYIGLNDAAQRLKVHPNSLGRLVRQRKGPPARLFAGKYLFRRDDVDRFAMTYDNRPGRKSRSARLF